VTPLALTLLPAVFFIAMVLTMVGLGGGLIFSPLFVLLGLPQAGAASAALLLNLVAAGAAAWTYARRGMVDYALGLPLIAASSLTAPLGAGLNLRLPPGVFLAVLATILTLAGAVMLLPPRAEEEPRAPRRARMLGGAAIGACTGLLGGLLGIGGGVFIVPLLVHVLGVPVRTAAASSTFIVCFSSLTGFAGYASLSAVDWAFVLPAAGACALGGLAGARLMAHRLHGRAVRLVFSLTLLAMSLGLLARLL